MVGTPGPMVNVVPALLWLKKKNSTLYPEDLSFETVHDDVETRNTATRWNRQCCYIPRKGHSQVALEKWLREQVPMGHGRLSEQAAAHPPAFLPAYEATEVTENDSAQSHKPLAITAGRISRKTRREESWANTWTESVAT